MLLRLKALALTLTVLLGILSWCGAGPALGATRTRNTSNPGRPSPVDPSSYVPGEILVKFKHGTSMATRMTIAGEAGADTVLNRSGSHGGKDTLLLSLDPNIPVEEAVRRLQRSGEVVFAEPNYLGQLLYTPSDADFPQQWGLANTGQEIGGIEGVPGADIDATHAWDLEPGDSNPVTVAVIDSGINAEHPDLDSRIWTNNGEVGDNSIDDDGNGYVDDLHGYNWAGISQRAYKYVLDGSYQPMYREFGAGADSLAFAQSILGTGCDLTHIGVMLSRVNNPAGETKVSIREQLSGPDIGFFTVSPAEITGSPAEIYKTLSQSLVLQEGTEYYIVVETQDADPDNNYLLYDYQMAKTNWFANRDGLEYAWDGSSWVFNLSDDLYFRTNPNPNPDDDNSHGTSVSGVIAAEHNGEGMAGVSPGATVMPLKVADSSGAFTIANLCDALRYAADNGAKVLNMSLSCPASQGVQDAINYAHGKGVVLFAAAGNNGDGTIWYPAACQNVIGVGATNNLDEKASFSNYNSSVDATAPGQGIYTIHRSGGDFLTSGTSFAAPHAAGLAALVLSAKPAYSPSQVEEAIEKYAEDLGEPGRDDFFGYGRIDAYKTLMGVFTPKIGSLDSAFGPHGSSVTIAGESFGDEQGDSRVTFGSAVATISSWSERKITCKVPEGISRTVPVTVTTAMGGSNAADFTVTRPTWYLAEGSTAWGFDACISIENPNELELSARVTYILSNGTTRARVVKLPGMSQTALNPTGDLGNRDFSTKIECLEGRNIAVDRTMHWSETSQGTAAGAHNSIGVTSPAKTWYLPEGSSAWGFDCWLLVLNPQSSDASVTLIYMIEGAGARSFKKKVPAHSRATFNMADDIGQADASIKVKSDNPVIAERAMYSGRTSLETGQVVRGEGHDSIGATVTANDYYLAEGTTAWGFTTYLLIQNPNKSPARVTLTYMTNTGETSDSPFAIPPESRKTVRVNDSHPDLDFSTRVHSDRPIVAERAMYWAVPGVSSSTLGMHDSIGVDSPHAAFYLPDGAVSIAGGGVDTFTLVQNPNSSDVTVRISYLKPLGEGNVVFTDTIKASSRKTYNMGDRLSETRASIMVECITPGKEIIVERSMYDYGRLVGTNSIGGFTD